MGSVCGRIDDTYARFMGFWEHHEFLPAAGMAQVYAGFTMLLRRPFYYIRTQMRFRAGRDSQVQEPQNFWRRRL